MRLTKRIAKVLGVLLAAGPDDLPWGLSICEDTGLGPGTVYPILDRLHEAGWIVYREDFETRPGGRNRVYYELTDIGRAEALERLEAWGRGPRRRHRR